MGNEESNELPRVETEQERAPVVVVRKVEDAIKLVRDENAVGIWEDTYMDQINPNYLVFFDEEKLDRFGELFLQARNASGGSSEKMKALKELNEIATTDIETGNLYWVYKNGEWSMPPEALISEAEMNRAQETDWDWFDDQRDHFAGFEEDEGGYALEEQSRRMKIDEESADN